MDEEASFANLLSQSTAPARPKWDTRVSDDPWANPFSDTPSTNPFASASPFGSSSTYIPPPTPESPREEISPYVQKLEEDVDAGVGVLPDPPSVIAAREQEEAGFASPYETPVQPISDPFDGPPAPDPALAPFSPLTSADLASSRPRTPPSRKLPSGLLDEDILGALDPSQSLKKAFVKSTAPARSNKTSADGARPKTYVFKPERKAGSLVVKEDVKEGVKERAKVAQVKVEQEQPPLDNEQGKKRPVETTQQPQKPNGLESSKQDIEPVARDGHREDEKRAADITTDIPASNGLGSERPSDQQDTVEKPAPVQTASSTPSRLAPASIPLPVSSDVTPTASCPVTPLPPLRSSETSEPTATSYNSAPPSAAIASTPTADRVAVSPLDAPAPNTDYGFKTLAIGGSSGSLPPPPPSKSPVSQTGDDWPVESKAISPLSSRLNGKGWGLLDGDDDRGLFGRGGPSVRPDPWGGTDSGGWGGSGLPSATSSAGPSRMASESSSSARPQVVQEEEDDDDKPLALTNGNSNQRKIINPLFQLSVGDPTRVGDPVRGYTVYTIRTRTLSPHYRRSEFSVLRRFSDFLWLFDALTANNPGVIVPPMPDKHPFGRFQDQFIETRRAALQRCLTKITSHPVLQLDPDLRLFLESDAFTVEAKNRRAEIPPDKQGLLSGWTGAARYVEQDDWFESRKNFLDNLESQLKALSKSIETASKTRLDMALAMGDFADSMTALAESDLGSAMCAALARLADLARREKESNEEQAKSDVMYLLNMSDEYVRFIGSVRLAFASRIKAYQNWQNLEKEVGRLRSVREKLRQSGRLGDRASSSLAEIGEAERRGRDALTEFEVVSRLVKSEFGRFERERVEEFKRVLERYLNGQIDKQKDLIGAWEEYHGVVLKMVQKSQTPT